MPTSDLAIEQKTSEEYMSEISINCPHCQGEILLSWKKEAGTDNKKSVSTTENRRVKPLIIWSDEYNTGIKDIDAQHRRLAALINEIHQWVKTGRSTPVGGGKMVEILEELRNYAIEHFAAEEELFLASDYPQKDHHVKKHDLFKKQVDQLYKSCEQSRIDLRPILGFLAGWFLDHIQGTDRQFVHYLKP